MSVLGSLAVNKNVYVVRVGDESEMNISHCSEEMKWIHLLKLFVPETHAQPKSFVPTPPSVTNSGGKIEKNGEKRDFAMPFQNTIRFLFCLGGTGLGRAGVGSLWPARSSGSLPGQARVCIQAASSRRP